jgi:hypothetical protein
MQGNLDAVSLSLRSIQTSCLTGLERAQGVTLSLADQESQQLASLISLAVGLQAQKVDMKLEALEKMSKVY